MSLESKLPTKSVDLSCFEPEVVHRCLCFSFHTVSFFQFDKSLRKQHEFYDHYRHVGTICEARVLLVHPGTFRKLQDYIIAHSTASYNQFKMPKKLRTKATLNLMMESVVDSATPESDPN